MVHSWENLKHYSRVDALQSFWPGFPVTICCALIIFPANVWTHEWVRSGQIKPKSQPIWGLFLGSFHPMIYALSQELLKAWDWPTGADWKIFRCSFRFSIVTKIQIYSQFQSWKWTKAQCHWALYFIQLSSNQHPMFEISVVKGSEISLSYDINAISLCTPNSTSVFKNRR